MSVDEIKLIEMTVDEARTTKWNDGVTTYRRQAGQGFAGDPVVCLHSEGIDALNYVGEISKQEREAWAYELSDLLWHANEIVRLTRKIHARRTASE